MTVSFIRWKEFFKQLEEKYPQHDYEFSFQALLLRSKFYNAIDTDSNQNQQRQFLKHFSGIRYQCLEDIPQDVSPFHWFLFIIEKVHVE